MPCPLLNHHKTLLLCTTPWAYPGVRQIFKRRIRRNALCVVTALGEIDIPAFFAFVLVHESDIPGGTYMCLEEERREEQVQVSAQKPSDGFVPERDDTCSLVGDYYDVCEGLNTHHPADRKKEEDLEHIIPLFTGPHPDRPTDRKNEYLPVTHLPGPRSLTDCGDHFVGIPVGDNDLNSGFGYKVKDILRTTPLLLNPLLLAPPFHISDGQGDLAEGFKRMLDVINFVAPNDGNNHLHSVHLHEWFGHDIIGVGRHTMFADIQPFQLLFG